MSADIVWELCHVCLHAGQLLYSSAGSSSGGVTVIQWEKKTTKTITSCGKQHLHPFATSV